MSTAEQAVLIDEITLICNGCHSNRVIRLETPLAGSQALIEWMKTKTTRCPCGAPTCDVKARLMPVN